MSTHFIHLHSYVRGSGSLQFGIGDYDPENDLISDLTKSDNGDAYRIFQTVLGTIPRFFEGNPEAIIFIQGSDGRPEFVDLCRVTCTKLCTLLCRKANQRMRIYCNYLDKNFEELGIYYLFLGGLLSANGEINLERYMTGSEYDTVLLFRK